MADKTADNMKFLAKTLLSAAINSIFGRLKTLEDSPPGSSVWGSITGTLSTQTDLQSALDAKLTKGTATAAQIDNHLGSTSNPHSTSDANLVTTDVTTNNVSTSKHGFAPKLPNDASKYLDGTGAYTTPAGSGSIRVPSYWVPAGHTTDATGYQGFTVRVPVGGVSARDARLMVGGTQIQLVLQGASAATATLDHVAIVERSGTTADGTTTPTEITFATGGHGTVIPADSIVFSDVITYTIDPTKGYLVILDFNASVASSVRRSSSAGVEYQKSATASWNSQTLSGASTFNFIIAVQAILVK